MLDLKTIDARYLALGVFLLAGATLAGAWIAQLLGYLPCELCLKQRYGYYAGLPLALAAFVASGANARAARFLFAILTLIFVANSALAFYHSGVEFKFWPGPADCTGGYAGAASMDDFMKQLNNIRVVRCDEVSLRIFGFSLANANIFISAAIAITAFMGMRRAGVRAG